MIVNISTICDLEINNHAIDKNNDRNIITPSKFPFRMKIYY